MKGKEIGGYFELELEKKNEYHKGALKLNSARFCIKEILKHTNCVALHLPYYICDSVVEQCIELNIEIKFYNINEDFLPESKIVLKDKEYLLYVNYFGVNDHNVKKLIDCYENIIIDNTQAFFYKDIDRSIYYVYSPRKFFGVSDGGYLYGDLELENTLIFDESHNRAGYLLKRIEKGAGEAYNLFKDNEIYLDHCSTMKMSKLTERVLQSIDYDKVKSIRNHNFNYIHEKLYTINRLRIHSTKVHGPMVYPLLIENESIKAELIKHKIYIPTYWQEVLTRDNINEFEEKLVKYLLPIPIDQRYTTEHMDYIVSLVRRNV